MASITITNLTSQPLPITELYATIAPNGTLTTNRYASDLPRMTSLQAAIAAGSAALTVAYSSNELASGLTQAPQSTTDKSAQPVAADATATQEIEVRKTLTAGVAGTPDDVTVYALNALPYKCRVIDAYAIISTAIGASTLQIRSQAAGAGTLCAEISSAALGKAEWDSTVTATQVLTPGSSVGLFIRRSDRGVAGEVVVVLRKEN